MIKCPKICDHYSTNYCIYVCQFNEFKEQNNKKHKKMIDLGFWDKDGNYIEDYQEVDKKELNIKDDDYIKSNENNHLLT